MNVVDGKFKVKSKGSVFSGMIFLLVMSAYLAILCGVFVRVYKFMMG